MYVFGGFNSLLLSDVLVYTSPSCSAFSSQATCAQAWPEILCVWNGTLEACLPWEGGGAAADQHQPSALCSSRSCRCPRCRSCSICAHLTTCSLQQKRLAFQRESQRMRCPQGVSLSVTGCCYLRRLSTRSRFRPQRQRNSCLKRWSGERQAELKKQKKTKRKPHKQFVFQKRQLAPVFGFPQHFLLRGPSPPC